MDNKLAIAIVSGGMDSITLAYLLKENGYDLHLLSFDYGQRHRKELMYAGIAARELGAKYDLINIMSYGKMLTGSALTDDNVEVPEGHYADDTMKDTVVPNRNAIMLAMAYGVAVAENALLVGTAVHAGDHFVYPDCRPGFIHAFAVMQANAVEGFGNPDLGLYAPFLNMYKQDIASIGHELGVDYSKTWSCYKGEALHCGKCGTCIERKEAFELAEIEDPTEYEDD